MKIAWDVILFAVMVIMLCLVVIKKCSNKQVVAPQAKQIYKQRSEALNENQKRDLEYKRIRKEMEKELEKDTPSKKAILNNLKTYLELQ